MIRGQRIHHDHENATTDTTYRIKKRGHLPLLPCPALSSCSLLLFPLQQRRAAGALGILEPQALFCRSRTIRFSLADSRSSGRLINIPSASNAETFNIFQSVRLPAAARDSMSDNALLFLAQLLTMYNVYAHVT